MFDQPSSGGWFAPANRNGHLLLITKVHEVDREHFDQLKGGTVTRMLIDIVDLDEQPAVLLTANNSHPGIINKLARLQNGGNPVLGRLTQVPTSKGNPAWVLGEFQPGDDKRAQAWLDANPTSSIAQPASTPAPSPAPAAAKAAPVDLGFGFLPDGRAITPEMHQLMQQI